MIVEKTKPIKVKAQSSPYLKDGEFDVKEVNELNFFDLSGDKSKTKGTSNKMYLAELHISKDGTKAQIMTMFGPTGTVQRKDYRYYCVNGNASKGIGDITKVQKEYMSLINSKRKKGYKDIEIAKRVLGSDEAKNIEKPVQLKNLDTVTQNYKSLINDGQKQIVQIMLGAQEHFVTTTLKCPLGQLTNKQIDDGRVCLDTAKTIVNSGNLSDIQKKELLELTNEFYGLIPHNLGSGARGKLDHLLLDDLQKIMGKEDDLDTLLDAKLMKATIDNTSTIDDKYNSLNCDFELVQKDNALFKFLSEYFEASKVRAHGYDSVHVKNIWKMHRKDAKEQSFKRVIENIAEECTHGHNLFAHETKNKCKDSFKWSSLLRMDLTVDEKLTFDKANAWLCWHGTRSANLAGITRRGLLVRPSGAVHTGSLYGDGKYFAWQSTKSLNYCDGGYWTGGKSSKKYMFLLDVAMGKMYIQEGSKFFKAAPKGYHSVYAKGGGYVKNDEMITYDIDDKNNQSSIRYILEVQ